MNLLRRKKKTPTLMDLPQSEHIERDPKREFAEIYGTAMVSQARLFIVCVCMSLICAFAVFALWQSSRDKVAIPWLVEVNNQTGVISRPVRMDTVTPSQAVIKSELAKWVEHAFTIDPKMSMNYLREASSKTTGKAVGQFREFRLEHDIVNKITRQPNYIRFAKVSSVDMSQRGFAFIFVRTHEIASDGKEVNPKSYRVRMDYTLIPPKTEEELLANPLGFYVSLFSPVEERS